MRISLLLALALISMAASCKQEQYPDLGDGLFAEFVTDKDTIIVKLTPEKTPVTVANFVALAEGMHPMVKDEYKDKRYYDGLTFHRVMNDFMIQGGDPTATGSGDPGYKFETEPDVTLKHDKPGILSMANSGGWTTNGSQFFITHKATPWLDPYDENGNLKPCNQPRVYCHTVFGEVVKGQNVVNAIVQGDKMQQVNIIRQGMAAKNFDAVKVWEAELPKLEEKRKQREEDARKKAEGELEIIKEKAEVAKAEFIKNNENLKGRIEKLPVGVAMIFTKEGNGPKPKSTEKVLVNYAGYFEDGNLFDTSWKDIATKYGQYNERRDSQGGYAPFSRIYNETAALVPGFRSAMLNMKVGDKARVFIPSYLAYGPAGSRGVIPPNANLIFDMEIMGIDKK